MKTTLRLLITDFCEKKCPGCCNKDWDLKNLPIAESYEGYEEILLTGGEPTLKVKLLFDTIIKIRKENPVAKIIVYTSNVFSLFQDWVNFVDGITLTLHDKRDFDLLRCVELSQIKHNHSLFDTFIKPRFYNDPTSGYYTSNGIRYNVNYITKRKSLRLNVFKGISVPKLYNKNNWQVKKNIKWIKDCPLPKNEEFKRLKL